MSQTQPDLWIDPRCTALESTFVGPFVELEEGVVLTVVDGGASRSEDGGATWSEPEALGPAVGPGALSSAGVLLRAATGDLVYVYMDLESKVWTWDETRAAPNPDARLEVWAIRSTDGGRTWGDRQRLFDGYCGALIDGVVHRDGILVVPVQRLLHDPGRHAICVYTSTDDGCSWVPGNIVDLGGHGHHDGAMEPTVYERSDGTLRMLIRTNWDVFWEALAGAAGRWWRIVRPTTIDASSSPGAALRLRSGRLALAWSRRERSDGGAYPRRGGDCQFSEVEAGWQREELSLALSEDDGDTWTEPQVVLRVTGQAPSYPSLFEPVAGTLWISTRYASRHRLAAQEDDFITQ